jgi:hypothetical protein
MRLTYTIEDDGVWLECHDCDWRHNLGQHPDLDDAVEAARTHAEHAPALTLGRKWAIDEEQDAFRPPKIGPLTAEEWCSFRLTGGDDDLLQCCAETSGVRDAIFEWLRMGGESVNWGRAALGHHLRAVESHDGMADHPTFAKLLAYLGWTTPVERAAAIVHYDEVTERLRDEGLI